MDATPSPSQTPSQTLSRGLRILDVLAEAGRAQTIAEIAAAIGVHRSVAYRLVRTLEDHGLVVRDAAGALLLGPHIATLARGIAADLQTAAQVELRRLADELGLTAFLVVLDRDECVTLTTVEPLHAIASIAQRPGTRHPVAVGAPGVALQTLLGRDERVGRGLDAVEPAEIAAARARGWAFSHGEVIPGVTSIAAPIRGAVPAAVAVLVVGDELPEGAGERVAAAAAAVGRATR